MEIKKGRPLNVNAVDDNILTPRHLAGPGMVHVLPYMLVENRIRSMGFTEKARTRKTIIVTHNHVGNEAFNGVTTKPGISKKNNHLSKGKHNTALRNSSRKAGYVPKEKV
jgi:hypothetical protein